MSVQSSINNMLAGFGYLSGQNAGAQREKRQKKLQEKYMGNKANAQAQTAAEAEKRYQDATDKVHSAKTDADIKKAYNERISAANDFASAYLDNQQLQQDYADAVSAYANDVAGKTNKQYLEGLKEADVANENLKEIIPELEHFTEDLAKNERDWINQPTKDVPLDKLSPDDRAGLQSVENLRRNYNLGMNMKAGLEQRFNMLRGNNNG